VFGKSAQRSGHAMLDVRANLVTYRACQGGKMPRNLVLVTQNSAAMISTSIRIGNRTQIDRHGPNARFNCS
jgi:hypothetical protein